MIPTETIADLQRDWEVEQQASKTYKMKIEEEQVKGYVDELEAVKQAVYKVINTERYEYMIYSWNYGIELQDLFGQPKVLVYPLLCERIKECLQHDDRIESVDSFFYDRINSKGSDLAIHFQVHTTKGSFMVEEVFTLHGIY